MGILLAVVLSLVIGWFLGYATRAWLKKSSAPEPETPELPEWFNWLADAPMFIDDRLVSFFYDAVLRPKYREIQVALSKEQTVTSGAKTSLELSAADLFPGLKAAVRSEASFSESTKHGRATTLEPIENAPRKLIELALHYLENSNYQDRIWKELRAAKEKPWQAPDRAVIETRPRMLAFLDFPKGTKFIPMAVETDEGVHAVYENLVRDLEIQGGDPCPSYPMDPDDSDFDENSNKYWRWFDEHWNAMKVLAALEKATSKTGRPRWVNYRVPVQDGLTLHLNVVGYGNYDTGIFAYSLIRRGYRHGVRIVGTVRSEPGLNVMAIYDK